MNTDKRKTELKQLAKKYVEMGWQVFAVWGVKDDGTCCCGDPKCLTNKIGKHPCAIYSPKGFYSATDDLAAIEGWIDDDPTINLGIATGAVSGVVVLDIDPDHGGEESIKEYEIPTTLTAKSGGNGRHCYFKHPGQDVVTKTKVFGDGVDVRGDGGYIIAAPSSHKSGGVYQWDDHDGSDLEQAEIAECPQWFLDKALKSNSKKKNKRSKAQVDSKQGDFIPDGCTNDTLFTIAEKLHWYGMSYENLLFMLELVNESQCQKPLDDDELQTIAGSAVQYPTQFDNADRFFDPSDMGNAERFASQHKSILRFNQGTGEWLFYDGVRWNLEQGKVQLYKLVKRTVRSIRKTSSDTSDELKAEYKKWAKVSKSRAKIESMKKLAQDESELVTFSDRFDRDSHLLNCLNGTINLRTGALQEHNPADLITNIAPVVYDPQATNPLWERFLEDLTNGDQELMDFYQVACGCSIVGGNIDEKMFFIQGPGGTGKSTFLEAVKAALGTYAKTSNFDCFTKKSLSSSGHSHEIVRLCGARLVISNEIDDDKALADGLIKSLTGRDTITIRDMYKDSFEVKPTFTIWLVANSFPKMNSLDSGMTRRIYRLPFVNVIPPGKRDSQLKDLLQNTETVGPAILNWMVQGALRWQRNGLSVPQAVEDATAEYFEEQNPLREFLDDAVEFGAGPDWYVPVAELKAAYIEWCGVHGVRMPLTPRKFNERIEAAGGEQKLKYVATVESRGQKKKTRCWVGLRLRDEYRDSFGGVAAA